MWRDHAVVLLYRDHLSSIADILLQASIKEQIEALVVPRSDQSGPWFLIEGPDEK
jgi:hypothetical protein